MSNPANLQYSLITSARKERQGKQVGWILMLQASFISESPTLQHCCVQEPSLLQTHAM